MSTTYKDQNGRLYQVSDHQNDLGQFYIEYRDPATSAMFKRLPGHSGNEDREAVLESMDNLAKDSGLVPEANDDQPVCPFLKPYNGTKYKFHCECGLTVDGGSFENQNACSGQATYEMCGFYQEVRAEAAKNVRLAAMTEAEAEAACLREDAGMEDEPKESSRPNCLCATCVSKSCPDSQCSDKDCTGHANCFMDECEDYVAAKPVSSEPPESVDERREPEPAKVPQKCKYAGAFAKDGLECKCDPGHRTTMAKVKPGDSVQCLTDGPAPDCRAYYAGRIIESEGEEVWKTMSHDSTDILREYVAKMETPKMAESKQAEVASADMNGDAAICQAETPPVAKSENATVNVREMPANLTQGSEAALAAFDFSELGDLAGQLAEDDEQFNLHYGRAQDEYLIACVYLARIHHLTAKAGRYGGGTWTEWYKSKGISEGSARTMVQNGDGFKSATPAELKSLPDLAKKDLNLLATSGVAEEAVTAASNGDAEHVAEMLAQIKSERAAREAAEQKAADQQKKNEELFMATHGMHVRAEQAEAQCSALLDREGQYIARIYELEKQPIEPKMVDKDELDRRAAELATQQTAALRTANEALQREAQEIKAKLEEAQAAPTDQPQADPVACIEMTADMAENLRYTRKMFFMATQGLDAQTRAQCVDTLLAATTELSTYLMAAGQECEEEATPFD